MSQVAERGQQVASSPAPAPPPDRRLRSAEIAKDGITTATQFAGLMSSLMSEVLSGEIAPAVCNATVNAGGKLLKVVEMQHRYGVPLKDGAAKELFLCLPVVPAPKSSAEDVMRREKIARLERELDALRADGRERSGD